MQILTLHFLNKTATTIFKYYIKKMLIFILSLN